MTSTARNRQTAVLIWSSLIVVTVLLLSRRVAGGIPNVASAWPSALISTLVTLLSACGWAAFRQQAGGSSLRSTQIAGVVAWLPTWLSGVALLPSDSAVGRGWLIGIAALSAAGIALSVSCNPQRFGASDSTARPLARLAASGVEQSTLLIAETTACDRPIPAASSDLSVFSPMENERFGKSTTQWMTRQLLAEGAEQIEGAIRIAIEAGQRTVSVHVPFSPPFAAVPQVECEIDGDQAARWKLAVVYAYGMRVELKREASDQPAEIELSYSATCETTASEAA